MNHHHLEARINKDTELRKVSVQVTQNLAKLLDGDDSILSILMGNIVKDLDNPTTSELRFTSNDIDQIRDHAQTIRKSPLLILLDEWSTMGKNRPKLCHLLALLTKCQLFRAADYVSDLIGESKPERPKEGPAARVDLDLPEDIEGVVNGMDYPFTGSDLNYNRPDNRPEINAPNLNFASLSGVSNVNNISSSPFKPIESYIPAYSVSFNSLPNQSRDLIAFSASQQATTSQRNDSSEPYIPALSLLNARDSGENIAQPRAIQANSVVQSAELPAFNDILPTHTNNQSTSNGDANIPLMSSLFINNSSTQSGHSNQQTSEQDSSNIPVFSQLFNGTNSTSQSHTRFSRMSTNSSLSSTSTDNE